MMNMIISNEITQLAFLQLQDASHQNHCGTHPLFVHVHTIYECSSISKFILQSNMFKKFQCIYMFRPGQWVIYFRRKLCTRTNFKLDFILQRCTSNSFYICENDINLLYLRHSPISATITEVGYFSALESAVRGVSLIVFLPLLKKFLNPNDFFLCIAGLISRAASSVTLALVRVKSVIYFVPFISLFIGFSSVAMRGVCSSFVLKEEQGKLFTIISCLQNITSLIASITFNEIYSATVAIDPGICYYGSAGISITLVCLSLFLWRRHNMIKSYVLLQESEIPAPGET
ncbi:solute carrier family 46 member 3 isoform X7 [Octopus sinensis]|uniref:Solute carrier family 46 member 3 isoform X7 n=1 Tax=Octopus sinensis TaxID=2607531 RepID=A0A7E6EW57_9MOLL|nr:solute carrier family 46 member 3 isoform X7 [Octopus sinensis]